MIRALLRYKSRQRDWTDKLVAMGACSEAVEFGRRYETFQAAWDACERGDHMLWWITKTRCGETSGTPERRLLVLTACACARLALPYVKAWELRPLRAIETAERWARQEAGVTLKDVRSAAYAAYAAFVDDSAATAAAAAASAAYAAYAASDAAAYAAYAAAYAAYAANSADARRDVLEQCAAIVRAAYPTPEAV